MSTPTSPSGPGRPAGATPVGARDDGGRRKKGLLWGGLAVLALIAIALLLSQCGGDDPATGTDAADSSRPATSSTAPSSDAEAGSSPTTTSESDAGAGAGAGGGAGSGELVAGDQDLLQLVAGGSAATALAEFAGQDATASGVQVLSVPADEGFWVGSSETERVWVQLTGESGESPYQVQEGDTVDFDGTLVPHEQAFASEVGVEESEGAAQLTEQGHHIEVAKSAVQLSE